MQAFRAPGRSWQQLVNAKRMLGRDPWRFQLMLDDADGETWHSRRSAAVRRPKDEQDFSAALPLLSELQRAWLRDAIRTAYGDENAWLERFN